ncbi:MAG TPA: 4-hydroxy-3-methylbut-2-enyl diphosphate reductase [Desulfobulbaceae bacterium]|nr:MAG: 4-hydroxy-3-methylbut-2-enyl diphosphate reductase [Deltaproteobacteria bacterium RIFOXYD12_FULL_53_23]HCC54694.1 4-hydroxy-3-methylbut-2-enyl diphosphate reductase [Desulfobulbaceae bacterium]
MDVVLAKNAGFCMGVRRAVETTLGMVQKGETAIATFGPLIHNPQVLKLLEEQGVQILTEIPAQATGTIIIRAHGIPPEEKKNLEATGAIIEDATCPRVLKVQAIIDRYKKEGFATVIIGDREHAEVEGLMGYAADTGQVVNNEADVASLRLDGPYIIVSQTTQDEYLFERLKEAILQRYPGGEVFNTICDSTHKRQEEVRQLCQEVEALIVVGGRTSANTKRLGEIAESLGCPVFMVESEMDLVRPALERYGRVGVTAGASTPNWVISRIVEVLANMTEKMPEEGKNAELV